MLIKFGEAFDLSTFKAFLRCSADSDDPPVSQLGQTGYPSQSPAAHLGCIQMTAELVAEQALAVAVQQKVADVAVVQRLEAELWL